GNNHFGLRAIEMRTPVRDDTVSAVRAMVLPAVTDDRVIRNRDRHAVDYRERWIRWFQARDTVRETFGSSGQLHKFCAGERVCHGRGNVKWKSDQASAKSTQSAASHLAPAVRGTNEHDAFNPRIG